MKHPLQITFRHMDVSPAAEARIYAEAAALEHYYDRITSGRVVVEAPNRHRQRGRGFHVTIDLHVPGGSIVINHEPALQACTLHAAEQDEVEKRDEASPEHKDLYVAIRDAFAAARRKLEDHVRILRGDVKRHSGADAGVEAA